MPPSKSISPSIHSLSVFTGKGNPFSSFVSFQRHAARLTGSKAWHKPNCPGGWALACHTVFESRSRFLRLLRRSSLTRPFVFFRSQLGTRCNALKSYFLRMKDWTGGQGLQWVLPYVRSNNFSFISILLKTLRPSIVPLKWILSMSYIWGMHNWGCQNLSSLR